MSDSMHANNNSGFLLVYFTVHDTLYVVTQ